MEKLFLLFSFFIFNLTGCNSNFLKKKSPTEVFFASQNKEIETILEEDVKSAKKSVWEVSLYLKFKEVSINLETTDRNSRIKADVETNYNKIYLGHGSGFFISPKLMVTNFHVIQNAIEKTDIISNRDSEKLNKVIFNKMKVLKVSAIYDLAILESKKTVEDYLTIKSPSSSFKQDKFFLLAYPDNRFIFTSIQYNSSQQNQQLLLFDRNLELGSLKGGSGGPIVDQNLEVVGVNHAGTDELSIAVSHSVLTSFLDGNNRDCSKLSLEDCFTKEWLFLEEAYAKGNSMAAHKMSFNETYQQWFKKRKKLRKIIDVREELNQIVKKLIKSLNSYNKNNTNDNLREYEELLSSYNEILKKYNSSVSAFNELIR